MKPVPGPAESWWDRIDELEQQVRDLEKRIEEIEKEGGPIRIEIAEKNPKDTPVGYSCPGCGGTTYCECPPGFNDWLDPEK